MARNSFCLTYMASWRLSGQNFPLLDLSALPQVKMFIEKQLVAKPSAKNPTGLARLARQRRLSIYSSSKAEIQVFSLRLLSRVKNCFHHVCLPLPPTPASPPDCPPLPRVESRPPSASAIDATLGRLACMAGHAFFPSGAHIFRPWLLNSTFRRRREKEG